MSDPLLSYEVLAGVIAQCAGAQVEAVVLSSEKPTFDHLDVDSLGVLGIVAELERLLGVRLGTDAEQCESPGELRDLVNSRHGSAG
ncbi:acyl carrier protein [Streptomyces sp. 846.5]|uniref:acyl carrier protein n=1 Tax=Streptacidiphilus sp. EB103A TaxID=3156275 RepID=UPI001063E9C0|nr:acyl carrier protein [Streptomyces sp. 846.5]TDU02177.1 minimal PKS acyl carrier protein [Streptomyces sp. 846.5]